MFFNHVHNHRLFYIFYFLSLLHRGYQRSKCVSPIEGIHQELVLGFFSETYGMGMLVLSEPSISFAVACKVTLFVY